MAEMDIEAELEQLRADLAYTPDPGQVAEWDTEQSVNFLEGARDGIFQKWSKDFEANEDSFKSIISDFGMEYGDWATFFDGMDDDEVEELRKCFDGTYSWEEVYGDDFAEWIVRFKELMNPRTPTPPPPPPTISVLVQQYDNVQNPSAIRDIITFQTDSVGVRPQVITVVRKTAVLQFANPEDALTYKKHFETSENYKCAYPQHLEEFSELNEYRPPPELDTDKLPVVPKQLEPLEPTPPPSPSPSPTPEPNWDEEYPMPVEAKMEEATESRSALLNALSQLENDDSVQEYPYKPPADVYGVVLKNAKMSGFSTSSLHKQINTILDYPSDFQQNVLPIREESKQPEERRKNPSRGRGRRKRRNKTPPPQVGGGHEDQKELEAVVDERQYHIDVQPDQDVLVYFWSRARQQAFIDGYKRLKEKAEIYKLGFEVKLSVIQHDHPLELDLATPKLLEAVSEFGTILSYKQDHSTRELVVRFETLEAVQILAHYNRIQLGPGEYIQCSQLPDYVQVKPVYRTMKNGWKNMKNVVAEDAQLPWEKREENMTHIEKIMSIGYVETEAQAQKFFDKHINHFNGDVDAAVEAAIQDITMTRYNSSQMCLPFTPQRERSEEDDAVVDNPVR